MHEREYAERLSRLRSLRNRRWVARPVGVDAARVVESLNRSAKRNDARLEAWESIVPESLRRGCRVESGGGVLNVRSPSAAARFALDRWLRGGGGDALRTAGAGRVVLR